MDARIVHIHVAEGGSRLDRFLAEQMADLSRTALQRLIQEGQVLVGGAPGKASYKVRPGDSIEVRIPPPPSTRLAVEPVPLRVIYEDASMLVVDKPAGVVVHPAPGHAAGTLVNALLAHCPELATHPGDRPGIVHRLDRDTSGLIVVAKTDAVRRALQRQFQARRVHKTYIALLFGHLQPMWGRIHARLGRDPHHRQRMAVQSGGREAITEYRVQEHLCLPGGRGTGDYTLVQAQPETGRTHQIRVHFASLGHPVVGDGTYSRRQTTLPLKRQFLHAWKLGFQHPQSSEYVEFEAPLPDDLASVLDLLHGRNLADAGRTPPLGPP